MRYLKIWSSGRETKASNLGGRFSFKGCWRWSGRLWKSCPCFYRRAIPVVLVMALLMLTGFYALISALTHNGEQTAQYMPADTELYLTVNIKPGPDQLLKLREVVDNWLDQENTSSATENCTCLDTPDTNEAPTEGCPPDTSEADNSQQQAQSTPSSLQDYIDQIEAETEININDDVVPWLGPELALGVRGVISESPEVIAIIGTTDINASRSVFFCKFLPWLLEGTGTEPHPTTHSDNYRCIETLYIEEINQYYAFDDEYIVFSNTRSLLLGTLDRILDGGDSLADTPGFQEAQDSLPKPEFILGEERVGMLYCNTDAIWEQYQVQKPLDGNQQSLINTLEPYIPPFLALSTYFVDDGMKVDFYCPVPDEMDIPALEPTSLNTARIVPGDALLFHSGSDANAVWQHMRTLMVDSWDDVGSTVNDIPRIPPRHYTAYCTFCHSSQSAYAGWYFVEWPSSHDKFPENSCQTCHQTMADIEWPGSFDALLSEIENETGVDVDADIIGWMNGEYAVAVLPYQDDIPEVLLFLEIEDQTQVEEHLKEIVDGANILMEESGEELQLVFTTVQCVPATMIINQTMSEQGLSPGYLFLQIDDTYYLVMGSTRDALAAAVVTYCQPDLALSQATEYERILSDLPRNTGTVTYLNIERTLDIVLSQLSPEERMEFEQEFSFLTDPLRALGMGISFEDGLIMASGGIYVEMAPVEPETFNNPPIVTNVSASQRAGVGMVDVSYDIADTDGDTVSISFQYWEGSQWIDCATAIGEETTSTGVGKTGTWNVAIDFPNQFSTNTKIRIIADDGQATNNVGEGESSVFTIDTKAPANVFCSTPVDNAIDISYYPTLTASTATDDTPPIKYQFRVAEDSEFTQGVQQSAWMDINSWAIGPLEQAQGYWWQVRASDAYGNECGWSSAFNFTTVPPPPIANFSAVPREIDEGDEVLFTDRSVSAQNNISWAWDFGDGTTGTGQSVSHSYHIPGSYSVSLTVTDYLGRTDTETKTDFIIVGDILSCQMIFPDAAATVVTDDGRIIVEFPVGAVADNAMVTIRDMPGISAPACPPGFRTGTSYFSIELTSDLVPCSMIDITVKYSDQDVAAAGGDPNLLVLSRYDEPAGEWIILPTVVDTVTQTLTASTDQLSLWTVMAPEVSAEPVKQELSNGSPIGIWIVVAVSCLLSVICLVILVMSRRLARS